MENQIEKFDPSKLMDGVRDRIRATFVSLIPDDAWDQMVEKEIYVFTTGRIIPHHEWIEYRDGKSIYKDWDERKPYSQETVAGEPDISPLQKMVRDMLEKRFRKDLEAYLRGEEYQGLWTEHGLPQASKFVEEVLVKNAGNIFHNIIAGMMQFGFERMRYDLMTQFADANRQF